MKKSHFNAANVFRSAIFGSSLWTRQWREAEPASSYNIVIVGGGLHGLATAYYLAKNHGLSNIAVVEKSWIGSGNAGRNTTLVRSNYLLPENQAFYEHALSLWENLSHELNYNVMFSQRGYVSLVHSPGAKESGARMYNAMRLAGSDAEFWNLTRLKRTIPFLDYSAARFPIYGAFHQGRAGTARHDAVAWGYARAADSLGIDIVQNCEVTGIERDGGNVTAIQTTRGRIAAKKLALSVAGSTSRLWQMAGFSHLPIETHLLQAFVTEPLKPFLDHVVTYMVGGHDFYISQSDKGGLVFGGDLDGYKSVRQRGNLPIVNETARCALSILPRASRTRLVRHWAGMTDMTMDGSPLIGKTPLANLYLNGGWCYGGFKATPAIGWHFADLIANDRPDEMIAPFALNRFETGHLLDELGVGPNPKLHG